MEYVKKTVDSPQGSYEMTLTDHSEEIHAARVTADRLAGGKVRTDLLAACSLLEVHDATGISLDDWRPVRHFVEATLGFTILENHV